MLDVDVGDERPVAMLGAGAGDGLERMVEVRLVLNETIYSSPELSALWAYECLTTDVAIGGSE